MAIDAPVGKTIMSQVSCVMVIMGNNTHPCNQCVSNSMMADLEVLHKALALILSACCNATALLQSSAVHAGLTMSLLQHANITAAFKRIRLSGTDLDECVCGWCSLKLAADICIAPVYCDCGLSLYTHFWHGLL